MQYNAFRAVLADLEIATGPQCGPTQPGLLKLDDARAVIGLVSLVGAHDTGGGCPNSGSPSALGSRQSREQGCVGGRRYSSNGNGPSCHQLDGSRVVCAAWDAVACRLCASLLWCRRGGPLSAWFATAPDAIGGERGRYQRPSSRSAAASPASHAPCVSSVTRLAAAAPDLARRPSPPFVTCALPNNLAPGGQ